MTQILECNIMKLYDSLNVLTECLNDAIVVVWLSCVIIVQKKHYRIVVNYNKT